MDKMENFQKEEVYTLHITKSEASEKKNPFLQKWIISQKVFYTKILHFTSSIFYIKPLDVTNKFLHKETSQLLKHD